VRRHPYTVQDATEALESAVRHTRAWQAGERDADAFRHLSHAVSSWEELVSIAESLRGPLANDLLEHQTDVADALADVWERAVGDRTYGIGGGS
jgi:hypothetical protein